MGWSLQVTYQGYQHCGKIHPGSKLDQYYHCSFCCGGGCLFVFALDCTCKWMRTVKLHLFIIHIDQAILLMVLRTATISFITHLTSQINKGLVQQQPCIFLSTSRFLSISPTYILANQAVSAILSYGLISLQIRPPYDSHLDQKNTLMRSPCVER